MPVDPKSLEAFRVSGQIDMQRFISLIAEIKMQISKNANFEFFINDLDASDAYSRVTHPKTLDSQCTTYYKM